MPTALSADLLWPVWLATFIVGASIGSFLNVCVGRWPHDLSVISPPSRCPHCGRGVKWHENVPIIGWFRVGGKCAGCGARLSIQYPLVEALVAIGWLASVLVFGPTFEAFRIAVVGTLLLGIALTDAQSYLIPDGFTVTGLLFAIVTTFVALYWFPDDVTHFVGPWDAVLGACVGAGAIRIIGWLAEVVLKREAMGFGDETLMAFVGALLGPPRTLLTIFAGATLGAVGFLLIVGPIVAVRARRRGEEFAFPDVPFGVFLAPAAMAVLLWGDRAIRWYTESVIGL